MTLKTWFSRHFLSLRGTVYHAWLPTLNCSPDLKILPAPFFQTCHILCVENSVLDAIWVIVGEGHFTDDNHSNLNAGLNHWQLDYCDCSSQALLLEA